MSYRDKAWYEAKIAELEARLRNYEDQSPGVYDFSKLKVPAQIQMYSGTTFHLLEPERSVYTIQDIAHALANLCRFGGHTSPFFSVAQHCVHVSYMVPPEHAFEALMHDAEEAIVGDMSTPLKQLCPDYKRIAHRIDQAIRKKFHLPLEQTPCVKVADLKALKQERNMLMQHGPHNIDWRIIDNVENEPMRMPPLEYCKLTFLDRFWELAPVRFVQQEMEREYNPFEPNNQSERWQNLCLVLERRRGRP